MSRLHPLRTADFTAKTPRRDQARALDRISGLQPCTAIDAAIGRGEPSAPTSTQFRGSVTNVGHHVGSCRRSADGHDQPTTTHPRTANSQWSFASRRQPPGSRRTPCRQTPPQSDRTPHRTPRNGESQADPGSAETRRAFANNVTRSLPATRSDHEHRRRHSDSSRSRQSPVWHRADERSRCALNKNRFRKAGLYSARSLVQNRCQLAEPETSPTEVVNPCPDCYSAIRFRTHTSSNAN